LSYEERLIQRRLIIFKRRRRGDLRRYSVREINNAHRIFPGKDAVRGTEKFAY